MFITAPLSVIMTATFISIMNQLYYIITYYSDVQKVGDGVMEHFTDSKMFLNQN